MTSDDSDSKKYGTSTNEEMKKQFATNPYQFIKEKQC